MNGKTFLITGGTGSFGNVVLNRFLTSDISAISIFSRDEKNQDDMRHFFQVALPEASSKLHSYIRDVRDIVTVRNTMYDDATRNTLTEFNSNKTQLLTVEAVKQKQISLQYIRDEIALCEANK